jgi:nitrite reductase/ring-hydroxylating ferredoxin subunit
VSERARIRVGERGEIDLRRTLVARISNERDGTPREAVVLVDRGGVVRAYVNRCKHLPIPLDGGSRRFWDDKEEHLMCGTHSAMFRREDGYCFAGPCRGASLDPLPVEVDASGTIWIED